MFNLSISKILFLYPNRAYIEFDVDNIETLRVPVPTLLFYVQRSESPHLEDSWETLNPNGTSDFYYLDETPRLLSFYQQTYYRVRTKYGTKLYYSEPTTVERNSRNDELLRKRKILYDEDIVLRKFSGRKLAIIKRRHIGERCSKCYDPNTGNVTRSHCSDCYGTGFKNPYYKPFITYGARLPVYKEVDEVGHDHGNELDFNKYQILDYPTVSPQDLVVDVEVNDRYKVDRVEQTEIRRVIVHQELVVTKLSRTSMEYRWPIEADLIDWPTNI